LNSISAFGVYTKNDELESVSTRVFKYPTSQVLTQLWYHYTVFQVFHTKANQLLVIVSDLFQLKVFRFPKLSDLVQWLELGRDWGCVCTSG
jgi:hypothetical protein